MFSTSENIIRNYIDGKQKFIEKFPEAKKKNKIFLSYSSSEQNKEDNEHLAEEIVRPILEMLDFEVYSYNKDHSQRSKPMEWIEAQIKNTDILVAFLTKDLKMNKDGIEEWHPKSNIPNEIGMVKEECLVIPFAEKETTIPSNVEEKYHCPPFTRDKYGELLFELLRILKTEKMF